MMLHVFLNTYFKQYYVYFHILPACNEVCIRKNVVVFCSNILLHLQ